MNKEDEKIMLAAMRTASKIAVVMPRDQWEEMLFPYWEEAAHKIFQKHGCPCHTSACFIKQSRKRKQYLLQEDLGFIAFLGYMDAALFHHRIKNRN